MKRQLTRYLWITSALLLTAALTVSMAVAQEEVEAAAESTPQGLGMLMLLVGAGALLATGFAFYSRDVAEANQSDA